MKPMELAGSSIALAVGAQCDDSRKDEGVSCE